MKTKILTTLGVVFFALLIVGVTVYAAKDPAAAPKKGSLERFVGYDADKQRLGVLFQQNDLDNPNLFTIFFIESLNKFTRLDIHGRTPSIDTYYELKDCIGTPYLEHIDESEYHVLGKEGGKFYIKNYIIYINYKDIDEGEVNKYAYEDGNGPIIETFNSKATFDWGTETTVCKNLDSPYETPKAIKLIETEYPYGSGVVPPIEIVYE